MREQENIIIARCRTLGSALLRWFGRPRVTLTIIVTLLVLYFLGLVIPQKIFFESLEQYEAWLDSHGVLGPVLDWLQFTDIYMSPVTLFFLVLFFLNLFLVVARRVPYILRKAMLTGEDDALDFDTDRLKKSSRSHEVVVEGVEPRVVTERIKSFFGERSWFVRQSEDGGKTFAVRNRLSALGFLLFHLSFVLCLAGGLMIYYTRFSGNIALTEGEAFRGDFQQFYSIGRQPKAMRGMELIEFMLEKASIDYETEEQREASNLDATLRVNFRGEQTVEHVRVNQPVRKGAYTILAIDLGGSPLFILRDARTGDEVDGAWVRLKASVNKEDLFSFNEPEEMAFHVRFFPDYIVEDGRERTRSRNFANPAYHVTVKQGDSVIADDTVRLGQAMAFETYVLEFRDIRYWVDFQVVREAGAWPLIAGFSLAVVGLMMRLIFYRREIRMAFENGRLCMVGKSEFYAHSFEEEMGRIANDISDYVMRTEERGEGASA